MNETTLTQTILIVEDEARLAEILGEYLLREGFRTERAKDGKRALELWRAARPDLILLDLMLPLIDGLEVARRVRAESDVPIIMLTARDEEVDKLVGLGLGADDYVVKPYSPREVVARVKAVLRRTNGADKLSVSYRVGALEVDEAIGLARDDPHVFDRRGPVDGAEESIGEGESAGVFPIVRDVLLPVLNVGVQIPLAGADRVEAVHPAPVDHGQPGDERVIDTHGRVARSRQRNRFVVTRKALGRALGSGEASEHVIEGAVLLDEEHEVLDLLARLTHDVAPRELAFDLGSDALGHEFRKRVDCVLVHAARRHWAGVRRLLRRRAHVIGGVVAGIRLAGGGDHQDAHRGDARRLQREPRSAHEGQDISGPALQGIGGRKLGSTP